MPAGGIMPTDRPDADDASNGSASTPDTCRGGAARTGLP